MNLLCAVSPSPFWYIIQNMFAFVLVTLKTAQRAPTWTPNWPNNQKSFTPPQGCKILFGQICTWRFWPSVCSHIYAEWGHRQLAHWRSIEVLLLKTGEEVQYNLLQFSIWCFWDLAVSPETKQMRSEWAFKNPYCWNIQICFSSYLMLESRSWCWLKMCCKKAFSNFVILLGSILSRWPLTPA